MSEVIITVRGEHETRVAPELGIADISVRCEGPSRGPVVERIAALAAPVRDELSRRQADGDVAEWSSERAAVWSERPWNNEGKQLAPVHHASVSFSASFSDFAALSWWLTAVSEREGVQVHTVVWQLTPATRRAVEAEVAAEAVRIAVSRATAYATAIDRGGVTPLEIADTGLLTRAETPPQAAPRMMRAAMMSSDAAGTGPGIDLQPQPIIVTAGVEGRFAAR
ncbi:MAG: SIMPL domain-containing protein [Microbacterium sp.]|uniref:SIMPL domain-containing protein n=1 Tax=unclassified Microbacterium TaxID=2609290 RepID=UPI000DB55514|nr:SIMPL domain-containing protein [Microbacterium sp.]PZU40283.1 MAG: SIMPL domain-containing protein [Microbacterium sp.]